MVLNISTHACNLDDQRRKGFLHWLNAHVPLMQDLDVWLGSLSVPLLLTEYCLIMGEVQWWRDLDPDAFKRILAAERPR